MLLQDSSMLPGMLPGMLYGMYVFVAPDTPKMQLSEGCPVTPEFRVEFNKWMVEFFGVTNFVEDGVVLRISGMLYTNPRTYAKLKEAFNDLHAS